MIHVIDSPHKAGRMSAYLIDPAWRGPFPTRWPKERWPVKERLFVKCNQITQAGQTFAYANGYNFKWFAGGTGTNTPTPSDKALQFEQQRFEMTDVVFAPGQIDAFAEIPPDTGNITWEEWALFLSDATRTRASGTMFSRLLYSFTKNLGDTILLNYTLTETV